MARAASWVVQVEAREEKRAAGYLGGVGVRVRVRVRVRVGVGVGAGQGGG